MLTDFLSHFGMVVVVALTLLVFGGLYIWDRKRRARMSEAERRDEDLATWGW